MRYIFLIITAIIIGCSGSSAGELDQRADSAYMADLFSEAATLYEEAAASEGVSSALYYNLGNCYYRMGKSGKAIVAYERALRLDPSNQDAKSNLEFVNSRITDRPGDRGTFISNTLDESSLIMSSNSWAWIAFILFLFSVGAAALYVFASGVAVRKIGFFGGIILIILCISAVVLAVRGASLASDTTQAVITAPSTILSTSPRVPKDRNEEAMLLHEGTKVSILDSVTTKIDTTDVKWYDVQVDNNHRAWIDGRALERI